MERFHPDALPGNHEEERALFGDITDDDGEDDTEQEEDSPSDDYFDEDNGTCEVLQNDAALNVFLTSWFLYRLVCYVIIMNWVKYRIPF